MNAKNPPADLSHAFWHKSSFSNGNGGACVEVSTNLSHIIAVRDSKDRQGAVLTFAPAEWKAFLRGAKNGEFDLF